MSHSPTPLDWFFPLGRPHTGLPLGNGLQGILIWGENSLHITVAHAGFWDHRNGQDIPSTTHYADVRRAVESHDEAAITRLFPKRAPGKAFPQQMPGGRLEITFPNSLRPIDARLDLSTAEVVVRIALHEDDTEIKTLRIRQASDTALCWIELPADLAEEVKIAAHPAYDLVFENVMAKLDIAAPEKWSEASSGGFTQPMQDDKPLSVAWKREGTSLRVASSLGFDGAEKARAAVTDFDAAALEEKTARFWTEYWSSVPSVTVPDPVLQELYDLGVYKQAGIIRANTPAATLQGMWMEDTRIPPWSNDYHFNINVQLVYGAALATGRHEDMRPLWDMLRSWLPRLRELGQNFYGVEGAMILPHAVDDRCQLMGSFWAGAIDQACIAWMGQIAFQQYEFTRDLEHLREVAFPLLQGAYLGYHAMLEKVETPEGGFRYSLPVSVSPEFGGSDLKTCWGRDASFQLAAFHSTARMLKAAAPILGLPEDPQWNEVSEHLPPFTPTPQGNGSYGWLSGERNRIALWEGQDLTESHRHHSHLAGIYPFLTLDPFDPAIHNTISFSVTHWNTTGAGNWVGFTLPWASAICSRCGLQDAALTWLHAFSRQFRTEGRASTHNSDVAGMFAWNDGSMAWPDNRKGSDYLYHEVMQMDGTMGAVSAIFEMLARYENGAISIADRLPKGWRDVSFSNIRFEGAFLVSATFRHGRLASAKVESLSSCPLRLKHFHEGSWTLDGQPQQGPVLALNQTEAGKGYELIFSYEPIHSLN
jgi:hypothetical protein